MEPRGPLTTCPECGWYWPTAENPRKRYCTPACRTRAWRRRVGKVAVGRFDNGYGMARCHPKQKHHAKGLCEACYKRSRRVPAPRPVARCHPDRPHYATALCRPCYVREWRARRAA